MAKKKINIKTKKRKLNFKRIITFLLIIVILTITIYKGIKVPIKNIYVIGNKIISDKEIIEISGVSNYPSFLLTSSKKIKTKLKENVYIKSVNIKKKMFGKVYIYINEKKVICSYDNKIILEDKNIIENIYNILEYPILISDIKNLNDKFIEKFSLIDNDILLKISEIEYSPNDVDDERFKLKMNDGNLVYITLSKIEKINKYNSIYSNMEGHKGIIYLDSGDYVEIKE